MRSLTFLVLLSGCFDPQIKQGGFTCHPPDHPQCPSGFQCVNGLCVQGQGSLPVQPQVESDLAVAEDLQPSPLPLPAPPDLARPAMPDLTAPPEDLARPHHADMAQPTCVATGGDCTYHKNSVCCSNYCIYSSNTCK
jgi:hypothetical protein